MKSTIWISYDLGIQGDYENLYAWLDDKKAKECGDSFAVLTFEFTDSLTKELKKELSEVVKLDKRARVYVIYRDRETNKNKGKFIVGGRKAAPWTGYSHSSSDIVDEEV
ncbi:hypothetical protein KKP04_02325 [Rhodomicrobium sp. Az07]|uniref:hypothetical protein n=1 Tax=Rhodomicrobium sp. Az07 TaxID=2839034 RepID=UPI001BEAD537|nr:hypothetical protein [Rhodomicrobium sp. Az07]MBT3069706.1 hypothetical protein [Rhodomicrobium sp. Az07]